MNQNERKKEIEINFIKKVKERIKKLRIKDGKVVAFRRDYEIRDDRVEWKNSGGFYLYKVRGSKLVESSKRFIIPFPWDGKDTEEENLRIAENLAERYTKAFNASDLKARAGLKKDLYYLADMGLTFSDAWDGAKDDLVEGSKEVGIGLMKKFTVSFDDCGTADLIDKGVYGKKNIEKQYKNTLAEILQLVGGEVYSQAEKAWTDEKYLEALKELKDKKKVSKKLLSELIEDWCAIYGPAIVTVRTKLKNI